jgi:hypothetical protein
MKRALWVKQVGACLVVVASLAGVAWADPTGTADVLQILNGVALKGVAGDEQRVFRTIDLITFEATYYDALPGCGGLPPSFVQLFVFTLEGELKFGFVTGSEEFEPGSKYRTLFLDLDPGELPIGSYKVAFLVVSCDNTRSTASDFMMIRVVAP